MSDDDPGCVCASSDYHAVCRGNTLLQSFRQGRFPYGSDAIDGDVYDGSALSLLKALPLGNSISAPFMVSKFIEKFHFFSKARRLAATYQHGDRINAVDARFVAKQDTTLGVWKKRWLMFGRNDATFAGSGEV